MSESIRVRLLLAKFEGDTEPTVVAAIDQAVWDHWDEADEADWKVEAQRRFGCEPTDLEWREAWASFAPDDLVAAFNVPVAYGQVESA